MLDSSCPHKIVKSYLHKDDNFGVCIELGYFCLKINHAENSKTLISNK